MNAVPPDFVGAIVDRTARLETFIASNTFTKPTLVIDTDLVAANFRELKKGLGAADIHYAVKANPTPAVIARLIEAGSHFDAASRGEIELCLSLGARPEAISFGNTVKRASDIEFAFNAGIRLFVADAEAELEKIARHAPGTEVYIRLLVEASEADWPLTRKFGCGSSKAVALLKMARDLGLIPVGFSFHVGSQTRRASMWEKPLDGIADTWAAAKNAGFDLTLLNIGGGFPAYYGDEIEGPAEYSAEVMRLVSERFGEVPRLMAEPGRGLVGDTGMIAAEVLLVSTKADGDENRWVYLDIGRFSGLAETEGEAIRYQIATARDGDPVGPCILAGPSCDSADVLYEKRPMLLPLSLEAGDRVIIRNCGAYTSSYSSVGFNGFPPLDVIAI